LSFFGEKSFVRAEFEVGDRQVVEKAATYPPHLSPAIDEIYVGKWGYLAVVMDIHSGAVVFVGDSKGSEALEPFWASLRRHRKVRFEAVTIEKSADRLRQTLEVNRPLATVYYLKEDLRQVWSWVGDKQADEWHLRSWLEMAKNSTKDMLLKFAKTLERLLEGILSISALSNGLWSEMVWPSKATIFS
jgi:hypothetical protein